MDNGVEGDSKAMRIISDDEITSIECGVFFFFQAEDGIRDYKVTGVQTCALPIYFVPAENGWQIPGRENFRLKTRAKTAMPVSLRSRNFRRMATVFTTWPATFGNGAAIGTGRIITRHWREPAAWP